MPGRSRLNAQLLAAHVGINAPHYRNSRFYNFPASFERLSSTPVSHANHHPRHLSALGPAAYFVDLVRLLEKHDLQRDLKMRRPDLWKLLLDRAHSEDLVPFLEIVNNVMRMHLTNDEAVTASDGSGDDESDQQKRRKRKRLARERLATAQYPTALPFHMPLVEIRAYLAHLGVDLSEVYETFGLSEDEPARVAEVLGLSPLEHRGLAVNLWSIMAESLRQSYGLATVPSAEGIGGLENVAKFLATTGLTPGQLGELLQFVPGASVAGENLAIKGLLYDSGEQVGDEDLGFLAQMHYTIRLGERMNWSFTDVVLATRCFWANDKKRLLMNLARFKHLRDKYELPVDVLCSFVTDMNTDDLIDATGAPVASLFDRVFNTPPFYHSVDAKEGGSSYDPVKHGAVSWNSTAQAHATRDTKSADALDHQNIRASLLAALEVNDDELQAIVDHLCEKVGEGLGLNAAKIPLDVETLTRFYRLSKMPRVLGMPVQDYLLMLECITGNGDHEIEIAEIHDLDHLCVVDFWADWLKETGLSPHQFQYLTTGALTGEAQRYLEPPFGASDEDLKSLAKAIRATMDACCIRPESFASATNSAQQAREVYAALVEGRLLDDVSRPDEPKELKALVTDERTKPRVRSKVTCRQVIDALATAPEVARSLVTLSAVDLERPSSATVPRTRADAEQILKWLQENALLDSEFRLDTDDQGDIRLRKEYSGPHFQDSSLSYALS